MTGLPRGPGARAAAAFVLAWTLVVTLLRAVRWPNDFAEAHWLLDYRIGLIKRGLAGELLSLATGLAGTRPDEPIIRAVSAAIFALLVAALGAVAWRVATRDRWSAASVATVAAFLSSSYVVMAAHLMGYLDHLVVLLTVAAVLLIMRGRAWWAGGLVAVAVLVHEQALVVGVPPVLLAWLLASGVLRARGAARLPALPALLPLASFGALAASGARLSPDVFQDTFVRHLGASPFVGGDMHLFVPEWLAGSVIDSAGGQLHRFAERLTSRDILAFVLPSVAAMVAFAAGRFRVGRLGAAALVTAVAAPQLLHMAGWDTVRIWTFSIVAAFICAWIVAETCPSSGRGASPGVIAISLTAVLVNVTTAVPLYDNLTERFDLGTRLWLYAPALAGCLWWVVIGWRRRT